MAAQSLSQHDFDEKFEGLLVFLVEAIAKIFAHGICLPPWPFTKSAEDKEQALRGLMLTKNHETAGAQKAVDRFQFKAPRMWCADRVADAWLPTQAAVAHDATCLARHIARSTAVLVPKGYDARAKAASGASMR